MKVALIIIICILILLRIGVSFVAVPERPSVLIPDAPGDHHFTGGFAVVREAVNAEQFQQLLDRVKATPRTQLKVLSEGVYQAVTRSLIWGFPDVTVLQLDGDKLTVAGHLVIGRSDLGVNRERILSWLQVLD